MSCGFPFYCGISTVLGRLTPEVPLYVNDAFLDHYNHPARARLRGLAANPEIPADLLRRLVTERFKDVRFGLTVRDVWTAGQFGALATHPDSQVRCTLAEAIYISAGQRATLVEDPDRTVLRTLALGPDHFVAFSWEPLPAPLPGWAYERLWERDSRLAVFLLENPWLPPELRERMNAGLKRPAAGPAPAGEPQAETPPADGPHAETPPADGPQAETPPADGPHAETPPSDRERAETGAVSDNDWTRACAAAEPHLSPETVARLATDPSPQVRLAVSMRPELSEADRAAIDYHVGRDDRINPAVWAVETADPEQLRRCAHSGHIGLRRSAALNRHLTPELISVLAADTDFAVRLLLCEQHRDVPPETVLQTFLEATTMTRGRLLSHPSLRRARLARLADSPDPQARALVARDPEASPEVLDRLSHDPHSRVRSSVAADPRLLPARVLELFDDPATTGYAAVSPHLPTPLMEQILDGAAVLDGETPSSAKPALFLGNWSPEDIAAVTADD